MRNNRIYCWWLGIAMICVHGHAVEGKTADANTVVLALSTTTTFSCEASATHSVGWHVILNGEEVEDASILNGIDIGQEMHLGGILFQRNVTVTAREEHNNVILQCVAIFSNNSRENVSELHLGIQGLLSSPGNVTTVNGSSSIFLSWTAPFTLDITDVDPDVSHYTVYITHVNTSQNWSENVTETEFIFTGLPGEGTPVPCHTYQFRVSAWNVVGEGNRSEPVYGCFIPENGTQSSTDQPEESLGTGGTSVPTTETKGQFLTAVVISVGVVITILLIGATTAIGIAGYLLRRRILQMRLDFINVAARTCALFRQTEDQRPQHGGETEENDGEMEDNINNSWVGNAQLVTQPGGETEVVNGNDHASRTRRPPHTSTNRPIEAAIARSDAGTEMRPLHVVFPGYHEEGIVLYSETAIGSASLCGSFETSGNAEKDRIFPMQRVSSFSKLITRQPSAITQSGGSIAVPTPPQAADLPCDSCLPRIRMVPELEESGSL